MMLKKGVHAKYVENKIEDWREKKERFKRIAKSTKNEQQLIIHNA
jgi:hypothetical protein